MALIKCDFHSVVLNLSTTISVILPQEPLQFGKQSKKYPTLYLLHGLGDDHSIWTRKTSIERYVEEMGLAVVMPQVDHSYYTDMEYGKKYWTFLTEELPHIVHSFFPLSEKREETFVAGLSMGGYGAYKWALRYPEKFAAAASLSGALDMATRHKNSPKAYHDIFGENSIDDTENDLLWLLRQGEQSSKPKPLLYQACGTEDFLYQDNLRFLEVAKGTTYQLQTDFGLGDHNWAYWDEKIRDVLKWFSLS